MIPYSYNMVDMGGIDLAEANGTVVDGLYNRLALARNACGDLILYNWQFVGIEIVPSACSTIDEGTSIIINGMIEVTEEDIVSIITLEPEPPVIVPLEAQANGIYEPPIGIDGYAPVTVNVSSSEPSLPSDYQEVEYITFDGNEFMLVENLPLSYLIDVVASNSVSESESCVIGYREPTNNNGDFEIRFQNGSLNIWARSSSYTYTVFTSNPAGSTVNVIREILVARVNDTREKFFIGKYSTESMMIPFKGNLHAIKLYDFTREQAALIQIDASRKFIPCYRKSDGEIGVYEVYTSMFYPNEGGGDLIKGPDVN